MAIAWTKIMLKLLAIGVNAIPWERIADEVLEWLRAKMADADDTLDTVTGKDLLDRLERILADRLGIKIDLDGDGTAGA